MPADVVKDFERHVAAIAGIYYRIDRGILTGRNATSTDAAIDWHMRAARGIVSAETDNANSPLWAALERRPKLAEKWNRLERRYYGLDSRRGIL